MAFPAPKYIQLYPTDRCNQNCGFCFNSRSDTLKDMSPADALDLLDLMADCRIPGLDIMGGEPFLLSWMPSFLRAAVEKGLMVNISTNGSFPEVMEDLMGINPHKLTVGISLEGSSSESHNRHTSANNYDKAIASITGLVSLGLNPVVKTVLTHESMADMQDIVAILKKMRIQRFYLIHRDLFTINPSERKAALSYPEFITFFLNLRKQNPDIEVNRVHASCFEKESLPNGIRCAGGVRKLSVMPDGAVYPCNLLSRFDYYCLGNIFRDSLDEIWSNPRLGLFRSFSSNRCSMPGCPNHPSCTGGCPAHAVFHGYDMHDTDIRCKGLSGLCPPDHLQCIQG